MKLHTLLLSVGPFVVGLGAMAWVDPSWFTEATYTELFLKFAVLGGVAALIAASIESTE